MTIRIDSNEKVSYQEYINISIDAPKLLVIDDPHEKFIVYETTVKTNSLSFAASHTRVRRRYRDFVWLYNRLKSIPNRIISVPSLPSRQYFWNFNSAFLHKRKEALEVFLKRVVRETIFLSSTSLHLFLQTDLTPIEMEDCIINGSVEEVMNTKTKVVEMDNDFTNSLESSEEVQEISKTNDENSDSDPKGDDEHHTPIFWKCEKSTMRKVASLPNFSPVVRNFNVGRSIFENNNNTTIQPLVASE
ncbi:sorting nexin-10B-like [Styela clava]